MRDDQRGAGDVWKPAPKYIDVEVRYFARVEVADLEPEYDDDETRMGEQDVLERLARNTVEQWIHDGDVSSDVTFTPIGEARCDVCDKVWPADEVALLTAAGTETWACADCRATKGA